MEVRHGVKGDICADHDDVAVCEVQKQDNTVDHAVAKCHQRVDRACLEAIEQLREQQGQVHVDTSLSFSIAPHPMAGAKRAWNRPSDVRRGQVRRYPPYLSGWFCCLSGRNR